MNENPPPPEHQHLGQPYDPLLITQTDIDDLVRLQKFHRIFGYILAAGILCGCPHFTIGLFTLITPPTGETGLMPQAFGGIFMFAGLFVMVAMGVMSYMNFQVEEKIKDRRDMTFIQIISALNCLFQPLGLAMGIYTFVITNRPSIRHLFR